MRVWTKQVDHLWQEGFGYATLAWVGLLAWSGGGAAIDRYWDKLMLVVRDRRLSVVGFVGIGLEGEVWLASSVTMIHRPSNVLVGIEE